MGNANDDDLGLDDMIQVRVSRAAKELIRGLGKAAGLRPGPMARVLLYKAIGLDPNSPASKGKKS